MILINDELQADMYKKDIEPNLEGWQYAYVRSRFQHPLRMHRSPKNVDVTMIARRDQVTQYVQSTRLARELLV